MDQGFLHPRHENLLCAVDETGIALVKINRPEKRNALSLAMWRALGGVFSAAAQDPSIRCVILSGGGGHFSAGADISEFGEVRAGAEAGRAYDEACDRATLLIRNCPKPVIAAVSGVAVGGGLGLALACDFRVADSTARMGIPAGRLGLVYSIVDSSLLSERIGTTKAKEVLFTSRIFDIEYATRLGLVDRVAASDVVETARAFAAEIIGNAPLSIAGNKAILNAISAGTAAADADRLQGLIDAAFDSRDYMEGQRAFAERRPPRFEGA